ncbi:type II toxin-antitoxin system VapC family toxin [Telmatospirillum sp.]|uniref:type II toxin-antitoxin system VapC family toxin n=1 Tax=Telmatospirillum sp. TaxID=2079197 RepID=UPI002840EED6|nr:type II toxin-antitoxin system VapC family toxin [Telmatospirillum sp.]MDR3440587.1 type II toxin-antitoxin system VapC family toxin [Telmatospirillum sp.]
MFVLDASVVASWCFPDESHPNAEAAFRRIADETALVPALLWFEFRNLLLMGERHNRLSEAQVVNSLKDVSELPIDVDHAPDESRVLSLARIHRLTVYDAVYLELAQRKELSLATLDRALIAAARAEKVPLVGEEA